MTFYILTIFLMFTGPAEVPPQVASKVFTSRTECETAEGTLLTMANSQDTVMGWYITDECTAIDRVAKS